MDVLACHQTPDYNAWYRGSADAVRRNLPVILEQYRGAGIPEELLILSGQAIYRMVGVDKILNLHPSVIPLSLNHAYHPLLQLCLEAF